MKAIAAVVALALAAGLVWWRASAPAPGPDRPLQGYIEGETLYVGPAEGERVDRLMVEAGQEVAAGAPLFVMSTTLLETQANEQRARLEQSEAQVANLRAAQQRPEQIAVLQAAVARAEAGLVLSTNEYERQATLYPKGATTKAALDQASAALNRDRATLEETRRSVEAARLGGRTQEIDAAEAAALAVRAQLRQTEARIARQTVKAPAGAMVQDIFLRPGEMANVGQPVLALLPPGNRKARFFAPEPLLARFPLGARVSVTCDSCPPDIHARVSFVSGQSEFTPPVIFSEEERAKLVFRIDARLDGAGARLPVGLPVAVRLAPESGVR